MPDPIEDLEGFTMPTVTPMPAADVRRRGDRIRRRNNALAAVGGVAAVAALAVPFAIFAGGQNQADTTPPPATQSPSSSVAWITQVPDGFDISSGMGDDQTTVTTSDDAVVEENVCGVAWYVTPQPTDQLSAAMVNAGSEGGHDRHLVVFRDAEQATAAMNQLAQAPASCDGTYSDEGVRYEMFPADASGSSAEDSTAWVQTLTDGTGTVTVAQQVGNALLIDTTNSNGVGDETVRQDGTDNLVERSQEVVANMCVFSALGCGGGGDTAVDSTIGEGAVPAIPADFPLDRGLPTGGLDGTVPAPDPTISCDHPAEKPKPVEKAHAQWRTISEIRDRQLLTFSRQTDAEAYVEAVSTTDCSPDRVTVVSTDASGALIAVGHNENAGAVGPGLVETYVVRVGRAVLLAQRIDEGYAWSADVEAEGETLAEDLSSELAPLVAAMCTFTDTGC